MTGFVVQGHFFKLILVLNHLLSSQMLMLYGYNHCIQKNLLVCDPKGLEYL